MEVIIHTFFTPVFLVKKKKKKKPLKFSLFHGRYLYENSYLKNGFSYHTKGNMHCQHSNIFIKCVKTLSALAYD